MKENKVEIDKINAATAVTLNEISTLNGKYGIGTYIKLMFLDYFRLIRLNYVRTDSVGLMLKYSRFMGGISVRPVYVDEFQKKSPLRRIIFFTLAPLETIVLWLAVFITLIYLTNGTSGKDIVGSSAYVFIQYIGLIFFIFLIAISASIKTSRLLWMARYMFYKNWRRYNIDMDKKYPLVANVDKLKYHFLINMFVASIVYGYELLIFILALALIKFGYGILVTNGSLLF